MALYITNKNQDVLWNVIHNNKYIQEYFSNYDPNFKIEWFRDIIGTFYNKNQHYSLTVSELQTLNRDTISYMINDIKNRNQSFYQSANTYASADLQRNVNNFTNIDTPPVEKNNKREIYANEFEERQREYQAMVERKAPEEVDFRDKNDGEDTVITNMDELVQKHLKEREKELQVHKYTESIETNALQHTNIQPILKIDSSSNIEIASEQLEEQSDKRVSWAFDITNKAIDEDRVFLKQAEYDKLLEASEKINAYEKQMKEMSDNYDSMQMDMKLMMKKIENLLKKDQVNE